MGFAKQTLKSSPGGGGGPFAKRMVEGCHPIESVTPLRQHFVLPPPLPGQGYRIWHPTYPKPSP